MVEGEEKRLEEIDGQKEHPGCFSMILGLFLRPSLAIALSQVHGLWGAAFLFIFFSLLVGAVGEGAYSYGKYYELALPIVREVARNVAPVSIVDGRLCWQSARNGEYSLVKNDWSIDFSRNAEVKPYVAGSPAKGIWVTEKGVSVWNLVQGEGNRVVRHEMIGEAQLKRMEKSLSSSGESELQEKDLVNACLVACAVAFPVLSLFFFLGHAWSIFFCLLIFCFASMLFRRDVRHSFSELFRTGLNLCAVPTLATLIWYGVTPPSWSFDNIFYVCFILYILFVYRDTLLFLRGRYDSGDAGRR